MAGAHLRAMRDDDWSEVADLVYVSLNYWSVANGRPALFAGGPAATRLFCQVYEALDPGRCLVAESAETGRLTGACFYRERETHVSLGIMSVHPIYFGQGIGKQLVEYITGFADDVGKPLRLISSAMNLDSFSLYTKAGFVPRLTYQDLLLAVPEGGLGRSPAELERVRTARPDDVQAMAAVERELAGISRVKDYEHFIENQEGFWHVSVLESSDGELDGFLASVGHPLLTILGPGAARTDAGGLALVAAELDRLRGRTVLCLVPVDRGELVRELYGWGARNCELHVHQIRGEYQPFRGVNIPTFMPETG